MTDIEKQISAIILNKALKNLQSNPLSNINCSVGLVDKDNIYNWKCVLTGPNDSPYKGGFFKFILKFPYDFPKHAPEIIFKTPILHLNVNPKETQNQALGHCCLSTINNWNPQTSIEDILMSIFGLFYANNPNSPFLGYGKEVINEFKNDKDAYNERVKYFTKKYADGLYIETNTTRWDFTYNK